ncbi:hypothetical protein JCM11251_003209 [Rhodosporidiobolus azoricus]
MAFPERVGNALSSIFLPNNSIYSDLDDPRHHRDSSPSHPSSDPDETGQHPQRLQEERLSVDDDPFSAVSPSVLSPNAQARALPPHEPHPHLPTSHPLPPLTQSEAEVHDPKSPFQSDPIPYELDSQPGSSSQTPTSSIYLPSHQNQPAAVPAVHATPISLSPPSSSVGSSGRPGGSAAGLGLGASRSAMMGQKSLMGLLGGTRTYEPGGRFAFGSVGVGEEEEEEEKETLAGQEQSTEQRDDLHSLAASLPPPPSALSDEAATASDTDDTASEEEEDVDAPPDFTTRIPLTSSSGPSSSSHRGRRRAAHSRLPYIPPGSSLTYSFSGRGGRRRGPAGGLIGSGLNAKERALWRWVNVEDLDGFLQQVYLYYVGKGIWAIGLERVLNLLTIGWVIGFSTFLLGCIDYPRLWHSHHLSEVVIPRCASRMSGFTLLLALTFAFFYLWRVVRFSFGVRRLWEMHEFYTELLEVPEGDIQTIPWHAIVSRLTLLRASHPSALSSRSSTGAGTGERLDAHDVANRIMREENYLIALFNKSVLDISLPLPRPLQRPAGWVFGGGEGGLKKRFGKSMLTRALEWNLRFCLLGFLFGRDGQVRRAFLSERNKGELVEALKRRFILMGIINAVFAPFIVLYLLMYSFFRYFEEYHKNPSSIGSRNFTPLARWKFREFNELPHLFQQRLRLAHPLSDTYIAQYPKAKTALLSRFVAFLAGSFAAVLILFSLIDPDAFLHFEITPGRTVLFYIGAFGAVLAVARGMVPDENRVVDPEELMRGIIEHTHYLPAEWKDKLHSAEVHVAFGKLFQMKVSLFFQEVFSVLITPFVLWYTLPHSAGAIVDFFREFTVHVDGLGYVCSFAVFDFKRHGDNKFGAPVQGQEERWKSTEGKMEKSFLTFAAHNPAWQPRDATQSLFLSKMTDALPSASSLQPPPPPLHFSFHNLHSPFGGGPHSRHPSAGSTALHPSHTRPSHRSRFLGPSAGVGTLAEEGTLNPESSTASARLRAEKARLYDRAFQQSTMLSSAVGGGTGGGRGGSKLNPSPRQQRRHDLSPQQQHLQAPQTPIDEESALDGDSFIAPTETQPFGLPSDEEDEVDHEHGEGSVERMKRAGLTSLAGELYRR